MNGIYIDLHKGCMQVGSCYSRLKIFNNFLFLLEKDSNPASFCDNTFTLVQLASLFHYNNATASQTYRLSNTLSLLPTMAASLLTIEQPLYTFPAEIHISWGSLGISTLREAPSDLCISFTVFLPSVVDLFISNSSLSYLHNKQFQMLLFVLL